MRVSTGMCGGGAGHVRVAIRFCYQTPLGCLTGSFLVFKQNLFKNNARVKQNLYN